MTLKRYLAQAYRRDILNESVVIEMPAPDPKLIAEIEAELAYINGLGLGANLVNRSFVLAQNKQALEKLLAQIRAQMREEEAQEKLQKESQKELQQEPQEG
jgi:hypothetical protein